MSTDQPTISVIIVTHNSAAVIGDCLKSIPAATARCTCEVIVVDNRSTDNSTTIVRQQRPEAQIISGAGNMGFGRACNLAAEAAGGEYLLFLNPDAVLDPLSLDHLIEAHRDRSRAGFAVPRLRYPDGAFQPSCRELPTIHNMIVSRGSALRKFLEKSPHKSLRYTLPDFTDITNVPAVAGTVALIRRELFLSAKGFDPRFFLFMEDTDLCARLGQSGLVHLYVPRAGAIHQWGKGSRTGRAVRIMRHHFSVWKYFLKHFPNGFSVVLLPVLLLMNALLSLLLPNYGKDTRP